MKNLVAKLREIENEPNAFVMEHLLGKEDRPADYDDGGWYDYNCNKFGTKWDVAIKMLNSIDITDEQIEIDCDTAWSPPGNFLKSLCKMYGVKVTIDYFEPGNNFSGHTEIEPEGITVDEEYPYLEGLYNKYDTGFWDEVQYYAESDVTDNMSYEDFLKRFPYVPEDYHPRLKEIYDAAVIKIQNLS
jgi:hypothetical protein